MPPDCSKLKWRRCTLAYVFKALARPSLPTKYVIGRSGSMLNVMASIFKCSTRKAISPDEVVTRTRSLRYVFPSVRDELDGSVILPEATATTYALREALL